MDKFKKLIDGLKRKSNALIALFGMILLVSLVFVYLYPNSKISLLIACIACGIMNIIQGIKYLDDKKKKNTGWSILTIGIIIIVVGFLVIRLS